MDARSRQVIAFYIGDRSRRSAKRLWAKIPQAYRQQATFYTDQYVGYAGVIPAAQPKAISKLARKTNYVERFNNTLRQRVSRLVRETLSFSKRVARAIASPRRQSGSMPSVLVRLLPIASVTPPLSWVRMAGIATTLGTWRIRWGKSVPTPGGCTICTGTSGSGCRIGSGCILWSR
jgi:IS1 family transposase